MIKHLLASCLAALALGITAAAAQVGQGGILPCAANSLSVTNTTGSVQLSTCGPTVVLLNIGTTEAFYNYGTSSVTATTSNFSIPAGAFATLNLNQTLNSPALFIAAITAASTTTIRIVQGWGGQ